MKITNLTVDKWQIFRNLNIDFDPRITFITGVNTTGKTSLCKLLVSIFISPQEFLAALDENDDRSVLGCVKFSTKELGTVSANITKKVFSPGGNTYTVLGDNIPAHHFGVYIKSNRIEYRYTPISGVFKPEKIQDFVYDSMFADDERYKKAIRGKKTINFLELLKNTLLGWAVYGYGNEVIESNYSMRKYFEDFEEILRKVLPDEIGFERFLIVANDIYCKTNKGRFPLDSSSSGLANVIEICWKCYVSLFGSENDENIVIIDEPENHLHPSLQQSIIPDLMRVFPDSQFIISTHSPLILSSVRDCKTYGLIFDKEYVNAKEIAYSNNLLDTEDVLRGILGLSSSMPIWAREIYTEIIDKYKQLDVNPENIASLEKELKISGLEDYNLTGLNDILRERNVKIKNFDPK